MKNFKSIAVALFVALTTLATAQDKKINTSKSVIAWTGKKVTGQHTGTVNFKEGTLTFKDGKLTGGNFTIDMTSIAVTDLKAGEGKEKLEGHLKADDFFGTDKYATAKLVIKSAKLKGKSKSIYTVTADLTIKDKTNPVTFELTVGQTIATTSLSVDRTKYGIEYKSGSIFDGLGDGAINDEFDLSVTLQY